jgi:hypothetical protein
MKVSRRKRKVSKSESQPPISFITKLLELAQGQKAGGQLPLNTVEVKGLDIPFKPVGEYCCPNTGVFYTIGKVQVIHVSIANRYEGMEAMLKLIQLRTRADGAQLRDRELYEMEMRTYKVLADKLMKQM